MRIGIDISQTAYENTGVGNYLSSLVAKLLEIDKENEYVLFFSSLRGKPSERIILKLEGNPRVKLKKFKIPPTALNIMWNKLHRVPIENFIGDVDIFITSDWTEPVTKRAKKATIIYDLIVYKSPEETAQKIVKTQKKKLSHVKLESDIIFTISESGKRDVEEVLGIDKSKIHVIYPGI